MPKGALPKPRSVICKKGRYFVPLTKGVHAEISKEDAAWVSKTAWHLAVRGYGARRVLRNGKSMIELLHRAVLEAAGKRGEKGQYADHINGNTLDNRRSNLRWVSPSESAFNRGRASRRRQDPGVRGVCFAPELNRTNPYMAYISCNYKRHHLGYFRTVEEASEAFQQAARHFFPSITPRV